MVNGEWGMVNGEWGMGNGEWGMGNGEWAKFRCASSLIPSNVSIAEPLYHLNASMGCCVGRVNNLLSCKRSVIRGNASTKSN